MTTKLNDIRDNPGAHTKRMRVGRGIGSGKGKTSGRGQKGQKSRSGVSIAGFEGGQMPLHMRLPKRGFNNPFRVEYAEVNLGTLQAAVDAGKINADAVLDGDALVAAGVITHAREGVRLLRVRVRLPCDAQPCFAPLRRRDAGEHLVELRVGPAARVRLEDDAPVEDEQLRQQLLVGVADEVAHQRAFVRIGRPQRRVREGVVEVFADRRALVEGPVAVDERRHDAVRVHREERRAVVLLPGEVDRDALVVEALLGQAEAHAPRRAGLPRVEELERHGSPSGTSTAVPDVARPSRSACARRTSASG